MTVHEFPRDHGSLANLDKDHHPQYLQDVVAEDDVTGFVRHYAALSRRNLTGGGVVTWDGQVLTTTSRLIWIPAGAGGQGHINLPIDGTGGVTIDTTADTWTITYLRPTDAELASGTSVSYTQPITEKYNQYTPHRNDLVVGIKNSDDEMFYMADGRILDYWHLPTFENGWTDYATSSWGQTRFRREEGGRVVRIEGMVKDGTSDAIFTLPSGWRPPRDIVFAQMHGAPAAYRLNINSGNGQVLAMNRTTNAWVNISCSFALDY